MSRTVETDTRKRSRSVAEDEAAEAEIRGRKSDAAADPPEPPPTFFDLKPDGPPPPQHHIPWGYGETGITALARDPYWLYVYWEATDEAIAEVRSRLGADGTHTWFVLRVYDTTYRLFDGTNANAQFDVPVEREWNNYFIKVDKPRSVFHVELGITSTTGNFAALARSGATEMPPDSMSGDTNSNWMTVMPEQSSPLPPPYEQRYTGKPWSPPPPAPHYSGTTTYHTGGEWKTIHSSTWHTEAESVLTFLLGGETAHGQWFEQVVGDRVVRWVRWQGKPERRFWTTGGEITSWEHIGPVEVWFTDPERIVHEGGVTRTEFGPWHVTISGIDAHGERRIFNTWMVHMSWSTGGVTTRVNSPAVYRRLFGAYVRREVVAGGSEMLIREDVGASQELVGGASESMWRSGGELLMLGGSEVLRLGASELMARGASEFFTLGASETQSQWGGASMFAAQGASGVVFGGASEVVLGGASLFAQSSEFSLGGASLFGQASELSLVGASHSAATENVFPGASEGFVGGSDLITGVSSGENWQGFTLADTRPGNGARNTPGSKKTPTEITQG